MTKKCEHEFEFVRETDVVITSPKGEAIKVKYDVDKCKKCECIYVHEKSKNNESQS